MKPRVVLLCVVSAVGAAYIAFSLWGRLGSRPDQDGLFASGLSTAEAARFERSAKPVSGAVADQLLALGWEEADAASIARTVESGLPVLAGFGFDEYLDDLDQRGLTGSESRIKARYEQRTSSPRWKQMVEEGLVPAAFYPARDLRGMAKLLLETNVSFYDSKLVSIHMDSVQVREGINIELESGERYHMFPSMSGDWTRHDSGAGLTVEFIGELSTGQTVRVCLLMATTRVRETEVWGIAACAILATGQERLMFPPF